MDVVDFAVLGIAAVVDAEVDIAVVAGTCLGHWKEYGDVAVGVGDIAHSQMVFVRMLGLDFELIDCPSRWGCTLVSE